MTVNPDESRIDPYAAGLAEDVAFWDADAALDLAQMLINMDGIPSACYSREARIGLVIDMIRFGDGGEITMPGYEAARKAEALKGRSWPSAGELYEAYSNDWNRVVDFASRVHFEHPSAVGSELKPHLTPSGWTEPGYTRDEVAYAVIRCRDAHGYWPRYAEYRRWAFVARKLARQARNAKHMVPSVTSVVKTFGSFDRAVEVAQKVAVDRDELVERREAKRASRAGTRSQNLPKNARLPESDWPGENRNSKSESENE